ncbi:MAG: T9SS type A sorting domain-containing protein, partial [candidate division Zixibacteria bacterium]|nr:T9SS type A sorting domain-containing protein [candidate division Zixibacteria bacterium]
TVDIADTVVNITPTATASRVSTKAACVYGRPRDPSTPDYYDCDLYYAQSTNGTTWDFTSAVNVTNYANADTFRVFSDIDAVYDYNDNLHIIWSAVVYDYAGGAGSYDSCALFHWSQATGITEIYRKFEYAYNPLYELNVSKCNIGVDPSNNLFAVWTGTDGSDTSAAGFTNGDLYYSYSTNNGASWSTPTNITDSQSPDCTPGNCDSDNYPSMDELVNQYMHIVYNHDTDPGSVIRGEGDEAICQILYHREDNPLWAGIDDENPPENYRIALTNYPNPFNNNTVFQLSQPVSGELKVYNIRGELVREFTLENTDFARWDGLNANGKYLASGLYFAKLKANGAEMVRRVVMVK